MDYEIVDTLIPGFVLRVRPSGVKAWEYRYRNQEGRQRRYVVGRFPGWELWLRGGWCSPWPPTWQPEPTSRREGAMPDWKARVRRYNMLETFLSDQIWTLGGHPFEDGNVQISRIKADFAGWINKPLAELKPAWIENWRTAQVEQGKQPKAINRDLQRLQALLLKAVDWGVLEEHPFRGLKPLKTDRTGRVRYFTAAEEVALREALSRREGTLREARIHFNEWRAARGKPPLPPRREPYVDHLQPIVLLEMNTGLRRSEVFHLRWEDIDFEAKWLTVQGVSAKNRQTRRIPLNAEALSTLETWRKLAKEGEPKFFQASAEED